MTSIELPPVEEHAPCSFHPEDTIRVLCARESPQTLIVEDASAFLRSLGCEVAASRRESARRNPQWIEGQQENLVRLSRLIQSRCPELMTFLGTLAATTKGANKRDMLAVAFSALAEAVDRRRSATLEPVDRFFP